MEDRWDRGPQGLPKASGLTKHVSPPQQGIGRRITALHLLDTPLLLPQRVYLIACTSRVSDCLMFNLQHVRTSRSCSAELSSVQLTPKLFVDLSHPSFRTFHLHLLNSIKFLSAHFHNLSIVKFCFSEQPPSPNWCHLSTVNFIIHAIKPSRFQSQLLRNNTI